MELVKCWEEEGVTVPEPYHRQLTVLLAPDRKGVEEINFNQAAIFPGGKTDYRKHDRPELIYVVHGSGVAVCDGQETPIKEDTALWVRAEEMHQIRNTSDGELKLATVFVPPYNAETLYCTCLKAAEEAT